MTQDEVEKRLGAFWFGVFAFVVFLVVSWVAFMLGRLYEGAIFDARLEGLPSAKAEARQ